MSKFDECCEHAGSGSLWMMDACRLPVFHPKHALKPRLGRHHPPHYYTCTCLPKGRRQFRLKLPHSSVKVCSERFAACRAPYIAAALNDVLDQPSAEQLRQQHSKDRTLWWGHRNDEEKLHSRKFRPESVVEAVSVKTCRWMRDDGIQTVICFYSAGRIGNDVPQLSELKQVRAHMVEGGNELVLSEKNALIDMYVKRGNMVGAWNIFDNMQAHNVVSWNMMILGYAKQEEGALALQLYAQMHQQGVQPSDRTFVAALKACSSLAAQDKSKQVDGRFLKLCNLETGRIIHSQVAKSGFESNLYVGTALVHMYTKCGSIEDARSVFEGMPQRNVVSWNAMISGHAQKEESVEALELYTQMLQKGVHPSDRTFVATLKACSSLAAIGGTEDGKTAKRGCMEKGRAIHSQAVKSDFETDVYVGTTLVDMYAKCGSMEDARHVFDALPHHDAVSWTAMILGYAEEGECALALELYTRMYQEGIVADHGTLVGSLKACSGLAALEEVVEVDGKLVKVGCLEKGRAIHSQVVTSGSELDVVVGTILVDMYAKCGSMEDARHVFVKLPHRDVVSWTAMIVGYVQNEEGVLALELFTCMQQEGVISDGRTFAAALAACSSLAALEEGTEVDGKVIKVGCLEKGRTIHCQAVESGFESDVFVGTTLVDMYSKCGSMEEARHVFDELPQRSVVSWNTMISGHAQKEEGMLALELYVKMHQEGVTVDDRTFVSVLKACSSLAALEEGQQVNGKFLKTGCLEKVKVIHSHLVGCSVESDIFVGTTLVDVYAKCGSLEDARHTFDELPHRSVVLWNTMITGYADQEEREEALKVYAEMQEEGLSANSATFLSILKACGNTAALEIGKELHVEICLVGLETFLHVANSLIDMYAKCGRMVDAQQLFNAYPTRDIVTWNTLIAGYARHGESENVFLLFETMRDEGVHPNGVTFRSVLAVCSHQGGVEQGQMFFGVMSKLYSITPTIEHYTCMIDLLGRAGRVEEAAAMVETMPFQPDVVLWFAVLGACQKWLNVEVGRNAFEHALRLDEKNAAAYVLMSNIYAAC